MTGAKYTKDGVSSHGSRSDAACLSGLPSLIRGQYSSGLPRVFTLVLHEAPQHFAGRPLLLGVVGVVSGAEDLTALPLIETTEAANAATTLKVQELEDGEGAVCCPFLRELIRFKESRDVPLLCIADVTEHYSERELSSTLAPVEHLVRQTPRQLKQVGARVGH